MHGGAETGRSPARYEKLVDRRNYDVGLGTLISYSQSEHQGSHKVWGTQLDDHGHYQPIDLQ